MSASALVCLAPGSEETEAVTTIDLLVRGGIKVTTASVASDGNLAITCSRGVKLLAWRACGPICRASWSHSWTGRRNRRACNPARPSSRKP